MSVPAAAPETNPGIDRSNPSEEDYRRRAKDLLDQLDDEDGLCPWCFARKRTFYPEFDLDLANRLYRGPRNGHRGSNKQTFSAMGHSLNEDGSLQVNSATSTADPSTYQEVVPPTWLNGEFYPPRSRTICECGTIDYDLDQIRSKSMMLTAIENMAEHLEEWGYPINLEAAKKMVRMGAENSNVTGRDMDIFERAIYLGLKHADDGDAATQQQ